MITAPFPYLITGFNGAINIQQNDNQLYCHCAENNYDDYHYAERNYSDHHYTRSRNAECRYAECHYAKSWHPLLGLSWPSYCIV